MHNLTNNVILEMTRDQVVANKLRDGQRLVKKWKDTTLLEHLSEDKAMNLAFLLENEAKELRTKILNEQTNVGDIAGFNKIAFPLVRRVFASLLTNEIVSVQPMQVPSGLVFYADFTFDRTKNGLLQGESVYGLRDTVQSPKMGGIGPSTGRGGYYGFQSLGFSNRMFLLGNTPVTPQYSITASSLWVGSQYTLTAFDFTVIDATVVDWLARGEMRPALSGELMFEQNGTYGVDSSSTWNTFRGVQAVRSLTGTTDTLAGSVDLQLTTYPSSNTVRIFSSTDLGLPSATGFQQAVLLGRVDTQLQDAASTNGVQTLLGDFENTIEIPQINLKILSSTITAQTKKMKSIWTPEMSQDLNAYMAMDAEVELTNMLSEQIATEIDREILNDLLTVAYVKAAWSRKIGKYVYVDSTGAVQTATLSGASSSTQSFYGTQDEWQNTLGHVMNAVSARIKKLNLKQGANWCVVGPQMSSLIQTIGKQFTAADESMSPDIQLEYSFGIQKVGSMSRWTIYEDPYFPEDKILLGYKGKSALEGGYVWAPYIPLIVTPTIFNPDNFNPIKGCITRNGKTVIRNDYYGTIRIMDLDFYGLGVL